VLQFLASRVSETPLPTEAYKAIQSHIYSDFWTYFRPEAVLLVTILLLLLLGMTTRWLGRFNRVHLMVAASLGVALLLCLGQDWSAAKPYFLDFGFLPDVATNAQRPGGDGAESVIGSMLAADGLSMFFRVLLLVTGLFTVWMGATAKEMRDRSLPEFYILMLGSLVGMMLLAGATHMLMVYLAIEMMSLPSYVLVALRRRQRRATEASLKYMLFGSVASGAMVYGLSLIYGISGGLSFHQVAEGMAYAGTNPDNLYALGIGLLLFIVGIGYKMAIAPMHFWCPDAYEGAPTPVTAFLSVASKAAGFAAAIRFVWMACGAIPPGSDVALQSLPWVELLAVIGILTMTVGNLAALRQNNMKRLLAYSSIAHAGYIMIGVTAIAAGRVVGGDDGNSVAAMGVVACALYLVAYMVTNYGAFAGVVAIENQDNDNEDISALRSLRKRNLFLAVCMFVVMVSLLGVPPAFGFWGKFYLFKVGVDAGAMGNNVIYAMLIAAAVNTAVSAYYYFKIVREMFLVEAERGSFRPFQMPLGIRSLVGVSSLGIIVLFVGLSLAAENRLVDGARGVINDGTTGHGFSLKLGANQPVPEDGDDRAGTDTASRPGESVTTAR
jgi:NADH-quinone oxidoreductase subunit N